jgi:hypothetical protein
MVTLSFVITVLIILEHLQTSLWKMTLTSVYLSARIDILKYWGHFVFSLESFITVVC